MKPDTGRSRRGFGIVLMVLAGHGVFFWQLARGLEHRPPAEGPVWMSQVSPPVIPLETAPASPLTPKAQDRANTPNPTPAPMRPPTSADMPEASVQVAAAAPRQPANCAFCRIGAVAPVKGW